jgi:hypothetical protein
VVIVEPHGIVKEGEQEYERRVGVGYSGRRASPAAATLFQWLSPCMEETLPVDLSRTASTSLPAPGMETRAPEPTLGCV